MTIYKFISNLQYINSNIDFDENKQVIFVYFHFNGVVSADYLEKAKNAFYTVLEDYLQIDRKLIPYSFINNTLCFTVSKEYLEK